MKAHLFRPPSLVLLSVFAILLIAACGGGGGGGRQRAVGGALWVGGHTDVVDADDLRRLREVGVAEFFVEAGTVGGSAESPRVERMDWPTLPAGAAVSLALRGSAPPEGTNFAAAAQALVTEIESLRREAEAHQLLPVGVHLETVSGADDKSDEALGEWIKAVRERLDPGLLLSLGLDRSTVMRDTALLAARKADFVVAWLYGQSADENDAPGAWAPERVEKDLDRLEAAKLDYLLGLRTVPRIELRGRDGVTRATTTRGGLRAFVNRPEIERRADDFFGGAGRIIYRFVARRPAEVFGLSAAGGEEFRVVRTSPGVVQDLLKRVTARNPRHYLGPLVARLAREGETLALSLDDVVTALGNGPSGPKLIPRIVVKSHRSDTWVFEIELANEGRQGTDLASTDWNFLQLRFAGGYVNRVVPGSFSRYRFWLKGQEVRPGIGGWREPDEVRLYTPLVEGGEILRAEIEVRVRSSAPELAVGGSFLLPEGRILELDPWNGSFLQISSR